MNKRRFTVLLAAALICIMITGCSAQTAVNNEPSTEPTATPTPKAGIEAVFDKPVTLAIVSNGDEAVSALFFEAATREAQSMGVSITTKAAGSDFDAALAEAQNADAMIAFLPQAAENGTSLNDLNKPTVVFEAKKSSVPEGMSHLYYESDAELDMSLNAALTYPPHDTPVRLILIFESVDSVAYAAYHKLYDEGKIFTKEIYIASDEELGVGEWLTEKLNSYVEGMLDAVFTENTTLAASAGDTLSALNRTDMEVFCPGVTEDVVSRMQSDPEVFAQAVGQNDALAGVLCVRTALQMLHGEEAVTHALEPALINAANFGDDTVAALMAMDSEAAALYNTDWMDTLRDYYSTAAETNVTE
jgi:hypothetical protein